MFYRFTNQRRTSAMYRKTMAQASLLLNQYTQSEIISAIDWCCEHPPPKGFTSLGWLEYDMNNILAKVQAREVKEEQRAMTPQIDNVVQHKKYEKTSNTQIDGFDFNLFK